MAEKVSGELRVIKKNDFGFYSVKIGDTWYGTGSKNEPAGVAKGDIVEGEFELEKGKYKTITKAGLKKAAQTAPAGASSGGDSEKMSKAEWARKDQTIQYQHAQNVGIAFATNPAVLEAAGVNKAKPADKMGLIEALYDKYTAQAFEDIATFGAVARATGAVAEDDKAAPPSEDDDE